MVSIVQIRQEKTPIWLRHHLVSIWAHSTHATEWHKWQPMSGYSDCHGLHNPCGLRVGYAWVGVRVGICWPWMNLYPRNGFRVTCTVTHHNWSHRQPTAHSHPWPWPPLTTSYNPWKRAVVCVLAMPTLKLPKLAAAFSSYSRFKLQIRGGVHITRWVLGHFAKYVYVLIHLNAAFSTRERPLRTTSAFSSYFGFKLQVPGGDAYNSVSIGPFY